MNVVTGMRKKEISDAGDDKGIRLELSRNIWTAIFLLPLVILNILHGVTVWTTGRDT
jgi:hypothetical protein